MAENFFELEDKLGRLCRLLHRCHLRARAGNGPMASPARGQGRILALLQIRDGISTRDLSYLLGIRISSLNELLSKMEKAGYTVREASEADKRVMLVKLTEEGRAQRQPEWDAGTVFDCLSGEEREAFGEYLDRIIAAIESNQEDEADEDERAWWMRKARERMGDETFECFMAGRGRGFMMRGQRGTGGFPHGGCCGGHWHGGESEASCGNGPLGAEKD